MAAFLALELIQPGFLILSGILLLWYPKRHRIEATRRHAARLAEIDAGADERFFEERRALLAYPPASSDPAWQSLGSLLFLLGTYQGYMLLTA
jgi:hypothetical protein